MSRHMSTYALKGRARGAFYQRLEQNIERQTAVRAYVLVPRQTDGKSALHWCATCFECNAQSFKKLDGDLKVATAPVARRFEADGWELEWDNPKSVRCPSCIKRSPKEKTLMDGRPVSLPPALPPLARKLTPDEWVKVRSLLDSRFDDVKGAYLDGYSDQRVGTEVNVPWASVRDIREMAYGSLRAAPELDAMGAEVATLQGRAKELIAQADALAKRISDAIAKMGLTA